MGSSGNLTAISLKKHPFDELKTIMLDKCLESATEWHYEDCDFTALYFDLHDMNLDDFLDHFECHVVDYCPPENGIWINGKYYNNWDNRCVPTIIDEYLILYDTDQQSYYYNLPSELLNQIKEQSVEIWT